MDEIISQFSPISLEEMSGIRLMNRTDTKFVTTMGKLEALLEMAGEEYRIQEIDGKRNMNYATVYFDSAEYDFYKAHHNGHAGRQKVRIRSYVDTKLSFLEVKTKDNHGKTNKKRISASELPICAGQDLLYASDDIKLSEDDKAIGFLAKHLRLDPHLLQQKIANQFQRITLVNRAKTERLTIDTHLQFHNLTTGNTYALEPIAIIELKRDGLQPSPVQAMLRELRIHPCGFSKYCIGEMLTNPALRMNRMKPRLRKIIKLINITSN